MEKDNNRGKKKAYVDLMENDIFLLLVKMFCCLLSKKKPKKKKLNYVVFFYKTRKYLSFM